MVNLPYNTFTHFSCISYHNSHMVIKMANRNEQGTEPALYSLVQQLAIHYCNFMHIQMMALDRVQNLK